MLCLKKSGSQAKWPFTSRLFQDQIRVYEALREAGFSSPPFFDFAPCRGGKIGIGFKSNVPFGMSNLGRIFRRGLRGSYAHAWTQKNSDCVRHQHR